jgi:hypothetical protein
MRFLRGIKKQQKRDIREKLKINALKDKLMNKGTT